MSELRMTDHGPVTVESTYCPGDHNGRYSIGDIKYWNRTRGFYFFERATMRFFRSRIASAPYHGKGGVFFITSEQFVGSDGHSAPRKYTVRRFDPLTGDCETAKYTADGSSAFNELRHLSDARDIARKLARGE